MLLHTVCRPWIKEGSHTLKRTQINSNPAGIKVSTCRPLHCDQRSAIAVITIAASTTSVEPEPDGPSSPSIAFGKSSSSICWSNGAGEARGGYRGSPTSSSTVVRMKFSDAWKAERFGVAMSEAPGGLSARSRSSMMNWLSRIQRTLLNRLGWGQVIG